MNIRILDRLRAVPGGYVPLRELGQDLEQVRADLASLIAFGFGIDQHPYRGASYVGPAELLCPDQIEHELATRRIGRRIVVWNRVTSTNDLAARAGNSISNDGLVILAEEQTSGRGRRGRSWSAPPRSSILMSVVLFPPRNLIPDDSTGIVGRTWLTALGAVATAEVISSLIGRQARIKWPNDVRVSGRKIAGILVERALAPDLVVASRERLVASEPGWGALIGIGLNANLSRQGFPPTVAGFATSLQIERNGASVDRSDVARELIRRLDHWYDLSCRGGPETLNAAWCQRSEHMGKVLTVETSSGTVVGRLVHLDVRIGLTLDLSPATSAFQHGLAAGPSIEHSVSGPGIDRKSNGRTRLASPGNAAERRLPHLAKLPLAEIQSIEPIDERDPLLGTDPDSWRHVDGTAPS